MSDETYAGWEERNEAYLSEAMRWLRLSLRRLAEQTAQAAPPAPVPVDDEEAGGGRRWPFRRETEADRRLALPPPSGVSVEDIEAARRSMEELADADSPPALLLLGERVGLSRFERDVVLLCAAMELDTRIAGLCADAQGDPQRAYPTFALALALFDDPAWEALSPERPLRYWRLIELTQPGAQPLTSSALSADERIVNYLKGMNYVDDRLAPLLAPLDVNTQEAALSPSQEQVARQVAWHLQQQSDGSRTSLVQLVGADRLSQQLVAREAMTGLGLHLYRLPAELLPADAADLEMLARLWQRESSLLPLALYLDAYERDSGAGGDGRGTGPLSSLQRFTSRSRGVFLVGAREPLPELGTTVTLEVNRPLPGEQRAAWQTALGREAGDNPARLAEQFNLNIPTIRHVAGSAVDRGNETGPLAERLWEACLVRTRPRLDQLAERLEPKATWEDIALPPEQEALLRQIAGQVGQRSTVYDTWGFRDKMNRGLGISALFAGASGTGKTMAAEVLANDLALNLYRIDLSAVVSKYIGETEKNLRRLFDAAEDGGTILFFDEADALFGKRSEVRDSHDRYANIETSYLLQRMEAYRGLAILATNMKNALDQAFLRRIRFVVNFPFPGPAERQRIWEHIFPAQTPVEGLDYAQLARLNMTGGNIHSVALNAAFLAAQAGKPVTMPLILEAARTEMQKMERPINEAHFRWQPVSGEVRS